MNNTYIDYLINSYKSKGIVIDTNILLLLFIGEFNVNMIENYSRTSIFTEEEFCILKNICNYMNKIIITPNILTEVNNLSKGLNPSYYLRFQEIVENLTEKNFSSKVLCRNELFSKFGITDVSILKIAEEGFLVITDDNKLFGYLRNSKLPVMSWNEIKNVIWSDILKI